MLGGRFVHSMIQEFNNQLIELVRFALNTLDA